MLRSDVRDSTVLYMYTITLDSEDNTTSQTQNIVDLAVSGTGQEGGSTTHLLVDSRKWRICAVVFLL